MRLVPLLSWNLRMDCALVMKIGGEPESLVRYCETTLTPSKRLHAVFDFKYRFSLRGSADRYEKVC